MPVDIDMVEVIHPGAAQSGGRRPETRRFPMAARPQARAGAGIACRRSAECRAERARARCAGLLTDGGLYTPL